MQIPLESHSTAARFTPACCAAMQHATRNTHHTTSARGILVPAAGLDVLEQRTERQHLALDLRQQQCSAVHVHVLMDGARGQCEHCSAKYSAEALHDAHLASRNARCGGEGWT